MDSFISLAKEGYQAYERSQSNVSATGGGEDDQSSSRPQYGGGGPSFNHDQVVNEAAQQGSGDTSLFSSALHHVKSNQQAHTEPVDVDGIEQAHDQVYNQGSAGGMDAQAMGGAAAMQALKMFTSSGGGVGGGMQGQLISMAMSEASNLFDSQGGAASGNKQDCVNGAAMTVMKFMVQSKLGGGFMGGGNSGGLGGLMSMASKFM